MLNLFYPHSKVKGASLYNVWYNSIVYDVWLKMAPNFEVEPLLSVKS